MITRTAMAALHVCLWMWVIGTLVSLAGCLQADDGTLGTNSEFVSEGEAVPAADPTWDIMGVFSPAARCARCHKATAQGDEPMAMRFPDENGDDISPRTTWRHSTMAHSFSDPYFNAVMQDEASVFPALSGFIEDKCLTCHTPMARTHAHQSGQFLGQENCILDDGCYRYDVAITQDHAREGISCTLCHQIDPTNLGQPDSFSGGYELPAAGTENSFLLHGPFENPTTNAMGVNGVRYGVAHGPHMEDASLCASCHTLYTPVVSVDTGSPTGDYFLEQAPFLEWKNSVYGYGNSEESSCQQCHMSNHVMDTPIAIRPSGTINPRWGQRPVFFRHDQLGGNTHLMQILSAFREELGIASISTAEGFSDMEARIRTNLGTPTADIAIVRTGWIDGQLEVDVEVTNNTGHKLPTGFPSRRVWVHFTVRDLQSDQVLFESGAADPDGTLSVDPASLREDCLSMHKPEGFFNEGCFEPHRDLITDASQVAIYEAVLADVNDHIVHVILHADHYLKDNRLPPRGFSLTSEAFDEDTGFVGVDGDLDFNGGAAGTGQDTVHYRLPLDLPPGHDVLVEAELLYQSVRPSFVYGLHAHESRVDRYKQMYEMMPPTVERLAAASKILD